MYNFDPDKIVFKDRKGSVMEKQRQVAKQIVDLLLNTNRTLTKISEITKSSQTTVRLINNGERWKELYNEPPYTTNPCRTTVRRMTGKIYNK